jgi:hypothetical protein
MLPNTAQNINLASLTIWSNNWGVLYSNFNLSQKIIPLPMQEVQKLPDTEKDKINSIIDAFIRDTKAKQAFRIS